MSGEIVAEDDDFPFEYVGGGYFRRKNVRKGESAEMLHGQEAIDYVLAKLAAVREDLAEGMR
jgi:hypothetical protein